MDEKFSNKAVSKLLKSIATAYILKNAVPAGRQESRFRIMAYEKAADVVDHLSAEIKDFWQQGKLDDVPGIGKAIASYLDEYFKTGHSRHFDHVLKKIPETVFILMEIPTIGPKKAYKLVQTLKLFKKETVINDLKKACFGNKVAQIENFGEKSQRDIIESIKIYEKRSIKEERMILPYAFSIASEIINYLKKNPYIKRVDALGSLRRMVSTIGDIDLAIVSSEKNIPQVIDYFIHYPKTIKIDNAGAKKASIIVSPNIRIDLRIQEEKSYGSMLQYFTGSKSHNIKLREYGLKKGWSLSEYGIKLLKKSQISNVKSQNYNSNLKIFEFSNEKNFYQFLGLQYIPPEIREGTDEIELAKNNKLLSLIELSDIKGDLHLHSSYNLQPSHDLGNNTFKEILKKAKELNYEYIGFSEHNPKSSLIDKEVVEIMRKRKEQIEKINNAYCFIGLEVDIFPNGHIALPKEAIKYLDYLIVAVHTSFNLDVKEMTARVLEALKNPKVKILGHPTGRYFGKREGFELEWEKIFETCKKNNIALEINAWSERLDLVDIHVREAIKHNVKLIINTDSHDVSQMQNIFYGVSVARRGWAKKSDIMNTLNYNEFKKWILRG